MTSSELMFCTVSLAASVIGQLLMKKAASARGSLLYILGAVVLQALSLCSAMFALQTLSLSMLVSVAAPAYLILPIFGAGLFGERLGARFWLGAVFVAAGIACTLI